jgi:predicted DNA-binding protein (UPF0251 family)
VKRLALEQVKTTHRLAEAAAENRITALRLARELDVSWEAIGEAMGMSRQTAHKRFAQAVDDPPPRPVAGGLTPSR